MPYEILKLVTIGDLTEPVSFTPPLRVDRIEIVRFLAPIYEAQYGAIEVQLDGKPINWRLIAKATGK